MKNLSKYKYYICGILMGSTLTFVGNSLASGNEVTAQIENWIKFNVNGIETSIPNDYTILNYNGRIYVPARFLAEQLGADVSWDANAQTVVIQDALKQQFDEQQKTIDQLKQQIALLQNNSTKSLKGQGNTSTVYQFEELQSHFENEGQNKTLVIQGKLRNISLTSRNPLRISAILYDMNNIAIGKGITSYTYSLNPNEAMSFIITITNPPENIDHYLVQVE
jgi:hypothetical protein